MKKISILGSTGSIGTQAINILSKYEDFKIVALATFHNTDLMLEQALKVKATDVVIYDEVIYARDKHKFEHHGIRVLSGMNGLIEIATLEGIDVVLNSVVGNIGLLPTLKAIQAKKHVAIANKECLVTAGEILMKEAAVNKVPILPIDSEHSALFQALQGNEQDWIKRVIITASGGPFRTVDQKDIVHKKANEALKHPNWAMGAKISIDSATLMNKGLEVIEAKWLYDLSIDQIDVVVHPQSIIHSMVEYHDHSIMAQMSLPTMELPILYALSYPERKPMSFETVDFVKMGQLTFEAPRHDAFPCLNLAYDAIRKGGLVPTALNAANEALVYKYLKDEISFYDIPKYVSEAMNKFDIRKVNSVDEILACDQEVRAFIKERL